MNFKRKLWWAQHRTDVYKYGTILSLVLIVTISIIYFTYSKFTSKNEMTAYETTVEPFIKNDYFIASYIDGEWSNEIPGKNDGYAVDKIVCDNGATGTWDNEEWGINIRNATKKIKCGVYFKKLVKLTEQITTLASTDTTNFATDDPDNNIRYIGKDPNNYIYFNCSDYSNQTDDTCEKWRIIGLFKNVTKEDGTKENLVKIISNDDKEVLERMFWDSKPSGRGTSKNGFGSNDWTDSQAMIMLNPAEYLKSGYSINDSGEILDTNSKKIFQGMGAYYNGTAGYSRCYYMGVVSPSNPNPPYICREIDFTTSGLKNDITRNTIESVKWALGGLDSSSNLPQAFYEAERNNNVYTDHADNWIGKIGLMYPSDYGYATGGGDTKSRSECLASNLYDYHETDCWRNNYLKKTWHQWTLTPVSTSNTEVFYINSITGSVSRYEAGNDMMPHTAWLRPTIYFKQSVLIDRGDGSSTNPYQLSVQ